MASHIQVIVYINWLFSVFLNNLVHLLIFLIKASKCIFKLIQVNIM